MCQEKGLVNGRVGTIVMRPPSQGGKERWREKRVGKEGGEGEQGGSWHAFAILQHHHPKPNPKTRIHLIGIVGKIYNELVSH